MSLRLQPRSMSRVRCTRHCFSSRTVLDSLAFTSCEFLFAALFLLLSSCLSILPRNWHAWNFCLCLFLYLSLFLCLLVFSGASSLDMSKLSAFDAMDLSCFHGEASPSACLCSISTKFCLPLLFCRPWFCQRASCKGSCLRVSPFRFL